MHDGALSPPPGDAPQDRPANPPDLGSTAAAELVTPPSRAKRVHTVRAVISVAEEDEDAPTRQPRKKLQPRTIAAPPPSSSPPPSTALVPSLSPAVSATLQQSIQHLTRASLNTISALRSALPTPSLIPHLQNELDVHQSTFTHSTTALAPELLSLTADYGGRLEGYGEEVRAVSYSVSRALSALSASSASDTSQAVHRVYGEYRRREEERANVRTMVAVLQGVREALRLRRDIVDAMTAHEYEKAVGLQFNWRRPTHRLRTQYMMESSVVVKQIEDEMNRTSQLLKSTLSARIHQAVQGFELNADADVGFSSSSSALLLVDAAVPLSAFTRAAYGLVEVTEPVVTAVLTVLRPLLSYTARMGIAHHWSMWLSTDPAIHSLSLTAIDELPAHISPHPLPPSVTLGDRVTALIVHPTPREHERGLDVFHLIPAVVRFVSQQTGSAFTSATWNALWSALSGMMTDLLLPSTVPCSVSELLSYSRVHAQVREMETALQASFQLRASTAPLSAWCDGIVDHFARAVGLAVLDRCRELIVDNDYRVYHDADTTALTSILHSHPPLFFPNSIPAYQSASGASGTATPSLTPEPAVVPPPLAMALQLHARTVRSFLATHSPISLHVFLFTLTLWETVVQALHALAVNASLASALLAVVHDGVVLLLAIPSVYNVGQLESVRMMSWLFANDCDWVAYSVQRMQQLIVTECKMAHIPATLLPSLGASPPPPSFDSTEGLRLLAVVAPVQAVGNKWRLHALTRMREDLTTSLSSLPPFVSLDQQRQLTAAVHSVRATVHQTMQQLRSLQSVCTPSTHALLVRQMLELLAEAMVQRVLEVSDISVDVGKAMETVLGEVNCKDVREVAGAALSVSKGWTRLEAVQCLIGSEQTLAKLEVLWDNGVFVSLNKDELQHLLTALYVDSSQRQHLIAKIQRSA